MIRKVFRLSLVAAALLMGMSVTGQSKYPLKVLFVGYDPVKPMPEFKRYYPGMESKELFTAEYPVRMPAFKALLSEYFADVKTEDCRDWKVADSDPFDVTIFDYKTTALEEAKTEKGADGTEKYISARYLPDNFSKPTIFIASTANEMGDRIGLKLDWLCLCLDADAHHVHLDHPIFNGPVVKVTPTMMEKKTPEPIFHYTTGANVPKAIPMWRVQTVGYDEGTDKCRIGLVSRGNRFTEGPDAEVISSGVCQKDVGAVALGRQGNFFLWGFGASPAQMTEEAKKVFVNVVAYMKQFDGKMPIARKYNQVQCTTDDVREIAAEVSKEKYDEYVKEIQDFNDHNAAEKKKLDAKKAAGQALTSVEEQEMQYLGHPQAIETWEQFAKRLEGQYGNRFGTDVDGFHQFITENFDYIYCDPNAFYTYAIDEDVKKIGISNHSIDLLDKCIDMLRQGDRPGLAETVLKRYTGENFTTANEWSGWLSTYRARLFFSETDGYRFMVNTYN